MGMPETLTCVRHAQSEANVVQTQGKEDPGALPPPGFQDRHDAHTRITTYGREVQSPITGIWIRQQHPNGFDRYSVSPLVRTCETAGALALGGDWRLDDRWREQDWGEYGMLNRAEQAALYELATRHRKLHEWYWTIPGGESKATGVRLRIEDILGTLHREMDGKRMIAVTHGGTMDVVRFILENMDPDQWEEEGRNPDRKIHNCLVLEYSRVEPGDRTRALAPQMRWVRGVVAWDPSLSWNGGEWMEISPRRTYSDAELLARAEQYPRLFPPAPRQAT